MAIVALVASWAAPSALASPTLTVTDCSSDAQLQANVTQANSDNAGDTIDFTCRAAPCGCRRRGPGTGEPIGLPVSPGPSHSSSDATRTVSLALRRGNAKAGARLMLTITLGRAPLHVLATGGRESLSATVTASNPNGSSTASARTVRLRGRR